MKDIEIPFASYEGKSSVAQNSNETLINMFAQVEISGRSRLVRRQRPGIQLTTSDATTKRCIEKFGDDHYAVLGSKFYRYRSETLTELGTLTSSTSRCTMVMNDNEEILISDGLSGYYWNGTTLSAASFPTQVGHVAYQGGFGLYFTPSDDRFYVTGLNDFSTVNALDFATAESYPDVALRIFVDHNEVWIFGKTSIEIWQLSGNADFPFARFSNAQIERGIMAPFSVAADDNTVFWLADDGVVYRADGYRPVRVSNHAVEKAIQGLSATAKANADALVYTIAGNKFYSLRFPDELTIQFNTATGFWNRARTYGNADWQVMGSAGHYSDYILTDNGISTLVQGLCTDEGEILERGGTSAPLFVDGRRLSLYDYFLDAEVGRADTGEDANVMLRVSRDGETYGNERWRSLGPIGSYKRRAVWRNLGQAREFSFELMMTDPVEFAIMGARGNVSVGDN